MFGFSEYISEYELKYWLRLVVIICGYLLLRPHLLKLAERTQRKQQEREDQKEQEQKASELTEDPDQKEQESPSLSSEPWRWGAKAVKKAQKAGKGKKTKEQIANEMDSDEDVSDLLQFDDQQ